MSLRSCWALIFTVNWKNKATFPRHSRQLFSWSVQIHVESAAHLNWVKAETHFNTTPHCLQYCHFPLFALLCALFWKVSQRGLYQVSPRGELPGRGARIRVLLYSVSPKGHWSNRWTQPVAKTYSHHILILLHDKMFWVECEQVSHPPLYR